MPFQITTSQLPLNAVLASQDEVVFAYPITKIWNPDGVSLQRRLESGELAFTAVDNVLTADTLQPYMVKSSEQAPTRCIDGRITKGWQPPADDLAAVLGPKIAGGTAHAALAHRIVNVQDLTKNLRFEADIQQVIKQYKAIGLGFGGHIDDHQTGPNTGCGAVDNINLILERLQLPEPQQQLRGLTKIILGDGYDDAVVNEVIGRMLLLDAVKPVYMPKESDDPHGEFLYKRRVVETIRAEAAEADEAVPALSGSHQEIAAVLNFAPHTTFDTDRFSYDHDNQLQVFAWDIWEMYEEARHLYPYDMQQSFSLQRRSVTNRIKHVTTRTLLGLATIMVLTDGSLRLVTVR